MRKMLYASILAILLLQSTGCRTIGEGCWWVAAGVGECWQDTKDSNQKRRYTNAFAKKIKKEPRMISLYDTYTIPIGKTTTIEKQRWVSLFDDGTFLALERAHTMRLLGYGGRSCTFVSGKWQKGEGTKIVLDYPKEMRFFDSAVVDLASATNFPSYIGKFRFGYPFIAPELQPALLPATTNQVDAAEVTR